MHKQFLLAALDQAWLGRGICAPNPSVGAIAVQNGKIIAQAWHQGAGTPHAEQALLARLEPALPGITLYVTLEPCNHWGRTPPCVEAIIKYGIQKVVYAYSDPNPVVINNNTPELLRKQGVEVEYFPLPEIALFYQSYQRWTCTHKPFVTCKIAQTLDGKIAGKQGQQLWLSNSLCAEFTHKKRQCSDVILTTARTINEDNPRLNVRLPGVQAAKHVAIIDRQGVLNQHANVLQTAKHCHIYHDEQIQMSTRHKNASYYPMPTLHGEMDMQAVISHLGHLGYHDVWVEAGGKLFTSLHKLGLVDRTYIYIVPFHLGTKAVSAYTSEEAFRRNCAITWKPMGDNMIVCLDWEKAAEKEQACLQD
ncbi:MULTISPECIES: bifunctional diaminohydroxyphosphoribosylaminopyrimidine deaminase/5-amino-6-(5-phosphoribosylamino)uracil reductase RibD [Legionella]|uniref:Riboflavin biosynthesis protein RibD n=1 Tax=Legionella septentrionalis TaxID=2498109 RepID=A0A433JIT2_9GAMM|nr:MULTISPECIES: bifunctional diaminohydroxyphosphoribosylaminopyrimidine deaminase/5-amino-6-(5-phosphoribosylamino)uracil reductase RibD [Legionella]MCP0913346.1 bifunctional diaminohydroxyphosphoribosylaminopyrimidine deaminase/5-amino-6-(5-phosphoribosylamino)uracil reductase RibD [Legionella sp. 27cVA30]RUQ85070.1 bifunctional diaminohydroxyphosphoribosylaminopyrimidine deaminase/5-amino-6-(5-phosphoribosylamino)uracil reductase RibD [Legionella septentrionalis]RUQ94309.1 bifunctional diami